MHYGELKKCDIANGIGVRVTLFVSGCTNHCEHCFQPQTWDFDYGQPFTSETEQQLSDMPANKPVLTLGDGTRINVWGNNLYFKETEKGQKIMLGDSLLSQKEDSITADNYNTLEVPLKCDFRFTMSDGTKVWINAGSTLKYPAKFAADSRTVYASGEIYLEVAKDAERPFYVVVDGITVKVLGTSFNIRAYADENETKVTLLEGKIAAQINDKEYTLTPGKQLKCDKTFGGTSVRTVDPAEIVSWTRGDYILKIIDITPYFLIYITVKKEKKQGCRRWQIR